MDVGSSGRRVCRLLLFVSAFVLGLGLLSSSVGAQTPDPVPSGRRVLATTVKGPITPVVAAHIDDGIERAERSGYGAYLIRLDTPGGLDTSMREIVQDILASEVPIIVHISPQGARGASAGAIIAFAAHVAAMAPGTTIGAATPVGGQGGEDLDSKIINDAIAYAEALADLRGRDRTFIVETVKDGRSASAPEALALGAIDVVAATTTDLLTAIDGRTTSVGATERPVVLRTAGAVVDDHEMGFLRSIQHFLADPNVAFLLLSIGTLGLIYELATPGIGVGGTLGVTFILLGMFGLAVLPVRLVGVAFLLLAAALFVAEVFAPGIGLAAAGGALLLVLSGIFLVEDAPGLELSLAAVVPTAIVVGCFVVFAGRLAARARSAPSTTTGTGLLEGHEAHVRRSGAGSQVFIQGGWWTARPADPHVDLVDGALVRIVGVEGLTLVVEEAVVDDEVEEVT